MRFFPQKAAVIGAGTMGAQIAAHLANAGIPVHLLDVVPTALTPDEQAADLTLASPAVRNRIVRTQFERMKKLLPPPFFTPEAASLVMLGNLEDDLDCLREVDWIVEAAPERLQLKQELHVRLAAVVKPDAVVTTNTSGLPLSRIAENLPETYRRRFLAAHFFNPPRYMRLVELVPTARTDPALFSAFAAFIEDVLGKGVVCAKDTPCFIANRIGCFDLLTVLSLAASESLGVDEVDALTGPLIGRPSSATFRLCDLVGIDLMIQLGRNLRELLPDPVERAAFTAPPFLDEMVKRGWSGEKQGQGFYKRVATPKGRTIHSLNLRTLEYEPRKTPRAISPMITGTPDLAERLRQLISIDHPAAHFIWKHLSTVLCYAAEHVPEIADDIVSVDRAMRWGYNWELGPFELWDAFGIAQVTSRLEREGRQVPALVTELLAAGYTCFYEQADAGLSRYVPTRRAFEPIVARATLSLPRLKAAGRVVETRSTASIIDLGDGVACLEFHAKMNVIGEEVLDVLQVACERVSRDFTALVIGNHGPHFTAGANLREFAGHIEAGRWTDLERMLARFQTATSTLRQFPQPVVAAVQGYTLGGGCEFAMGCDHVVAASETSMGLPEAGAGLIPGAHGTKEMLVRCTDTILRNHDPDYLASVRLAWETVLKMKISTSASDAARLNFLRHGEWTQVLDREQLLHHAKKQALRLADGYRPKPPRTDIPAVGATGLGVLKAMLHAMVNAGHLTEHDAKIGRKLAHILCGGDLTGLHFLPERHFLELEREAFLSLCSEPKTLERIRHLLATGKPLKN